MPEFFLELFSEEIPARMQTRAAEDLARLVGESLAALAPQEVRSFHGPRRVCRRKWPRAEPSSEDRAPPRPSRR